MSKRRGIYFGRLDQVGINTDLGHRMCHRNYFSGANGHGSNVYSTKEAAQKQKNADDNEPPWMVRGKFRIACCATLVNYLAAKTGIDKTQIEARKTESGTLHVSWANSRGLHKYKQRIGQFYNTKEADYLELCKEMRG